MSKTILITGASSGIGAASARVAVAEGHRVVLAARSADKLEELVDELGAANAAAIDCDVADFASQQRLFAAAEERFGGLDVVFANAGIGASAPGTENGDPDEFHRMIETNIYGATLTAKLAIPALKKTRGHLVMTGSRAGRVAIPGSVYGATKWYIRGYVENLRAELDGAGIRVTNLEPGMVDTPFFETSKPDALRAEDIAHAFIFAISQPDHAVIADMLVIPAPKR